jgi:DnaJ-class molecular chaperone
MKNYYYILGVKETASIDEIKIAYRKLSVKFHPDKNDGDAFFTERFKEIQEAYEVLANDQKRKNYDFAKNSGNNQSHRGNTGSNFSPEIESFTCDKSSFEYDEPITFRWKTINADMVKISPFGVVPPIGEKTYKVKNFKSASLIFEITAENTNINRQVKRSLNLKNKTYHDLYTHFKKLIETDKASTNTNADTNTRTEYDRTPTPEDDGGGLNWLIWFHIIIFAVLAIFVIKTCNPS